MTDTLRIANNVLRRGFEENVEINLMKLDKLMYLLYGKYLRDTGGVSLFPSRFVVGKKGPVLQDTTMYFQKYGSDATGRQIDDYAKHNGEAQAFDEEKHVTLKETLDYVWEKFGHLSAEDLSDITHRDRTGWRKARELGWAIIQDVHIFAEEDACLAEKEPTYA